VLETLKKDLPHNEQTRLLEQKQAIQETRELQEALATQIENSEAFTAHPRDGKHTIEFEVTEDGSGKIELVYSGDENPEKPETETPQTDNAKKEDGVPVAKTAIPEEKKQARPVKKPRAKKRGAFFNWFYEKLYGTFMPPLTAQQTIPYIHMHKDGVLQLTDTIFNKTLAFEDINYSLAQAEHQEQILLQYCQFLNYFDATVSVQMSFINKYGNMQEFAKSIDIPHREDSVEHIRDEYREMLHGQMEKGNNGLVKMKFITFGLEARDYAEAKSRLERIEVDTINNFKAFNVKSRPLNGTERLAVLFNQTHPDGKGKFIFDWTKVEKGFSTKNGIAPKSFWFGNKKYFKMGKSYVSVSYLQISAPEVNDKLLSDYLNMDNAITVNLHIQSVDQSEAIKDAKRQLSDLDAKKIDEQKKASRAGYDPDIMSADIKTYGDDMKRILSDLQSRNERLFKVTLLIMISADTKKELENLMFAANGIAQKHNCALKSLDDQQEQGFVSSLAIGKNEIDITRELLTSATAIFVPFTTSELFLGGEALYYGLNALSNNLIMGNRKELTNPNGLILGVPGSGKSFAAKREIVNAYLITNDDVIVVDPEGEYTPVITELGGQVVNLSLTSQDYINPMDINLDIEDSDGDQVSLKADFIISMCELIAGGKQGLSNLEISVIDRCVKLTYRKYLADPKPENMPLLEDFLEIIREQEEPEAKNIAVALELYVTGSQRLFNNHTNIDVKNRLLCFNIKELSQTLKRIAMLVLQDAVWTRVAVNRGLRKSTWYYIDEFHLLLNEEQTARYSVAIWKRFRKWGGIPTGITQNIKDLLASRQIQNIFENSDFILMLNQAAGDRQILAAQLSISDHQLSYVTQSAPGEGLIFHGNTIIPFVDRFPRDTTLYKIMTTRLRETGGQKQ